MWPAFQALAVALIACVLYRALTYKARLPTPYLCPPGPRPLPVFGNIRDLTTKELWLRAEKWAKEFGSITYLHVFGKGLVFLNTPEAIFELLDKRGAIYSDRPHLVMANELCGCKDMVAFTPYGETFRRKRRLFQMALGPSCIGSYHPLLQLETKPFLRRLLADPERYMDHIRRYAGGVSLLVVYGHQVKSNDDTFLKLAEECIHILANKVASSGQIWPVDVFPFLKHLPHWFPGISFKRDAERWKAKMQEFVNRPYEFVLDEMRKGSATSCFVSMLVDPDTYRNGGGVASKTDESFERNGDMRNEPNYGKPTRRTRMADAQNDHDIRWTANSMYSGSVDTSLTVLSLFLLAMVQHPHVLKRAQAEIDNVVGDERLPTFDDRVQLPYCHAVFLETLRWGVPVPLTLPHRLMEDDVYDGKFIPKGSLVFGNIWAILRNEIFYPNPHVFDPERFLQLPRAGNSTSPNPREEQSISSISGPRGPCNSLDLDPSRGNMGVTERTNDIADRRRDPRTYVFGSGRRRCPGAHLAESSLWLLMVSMIATLDMSKAKVPDNWEATNNRSTSGPEAVIDPEIVFDNSVFRIPNQFKCSIRPRSDRALRILMEEEKIN